MWNIYLDNITPTLDYQLPNPSNEPEIKITSTRETVVLIDGSKAYVTPQIKSRNEAIEIEISPLHNIPAIEIKIKSYINNATKCRIVTHEGEEIVGWFMDCRKRYSLISREQKYYLAITFERE